MCQGEIQGTGEISARSSDPVTCRIPYTCGELWQGTLGGEQPALVSLPIDWYSEVVAHIYMDSDKISDNQLRRTFTTKSQQAFMKVMGDYRPRHTDFISIRSNAPKSKGMGSSTADVAATIYAIARALNRNISPKEAAEIAISIEPSNGTIFPGFCIFDHRGGKVYEDIGVTPNPKLGIIILGFPGEVDTVAYNQNYKADILREMVIDHREALVAIKRGFRYDNLDDIGYGATLSARCHQRVLYKPQLEKVIKVSREVHAVGVNVAHSGTVIGVLIDPAFADMEAIARHFKYRIPCEFIRIHYMVQGGPRYGKDQPRESAPSV